MARRRISASQLRSKLRQIEQKQRSEINKYNQAARKYNQGLKRAINKYNQDVRAYNSRVRSQRIRIQSEIRKLQSRHTVTSTVTIRTSAIRLYESYGRLESKYEGHQPNEYEENLLALSENESANSLALANAIENPAELESTHEDLQTSQIIDELAKISDDLDQRWKGAIYSLNPQNPDATRHFCTSSREIFTEILEVCAPDSKVVSAIVDCPVTPKGKPTRKAKVTYLLQEKGFDEDSLSEFAEEDIRNILELFEVLNSGTHGSAGKYGHAMLHSIKRRVEDGILFLAEIATAGGSH